MIHGKINNSPWGWTSAACSRRWKRRRPVAPSRCHRPPPTVGTTGF